MMYLDWFVGTMRRTFNIEVKREDVGTRKKLYEVWIKNGNKLLMRCISTKLNSIGIHDISYCKLMTKLMGRLCCLTESMSDKEFQ